MPWEDNREMKEGERTLSVKAGKRVDPTVTKRVR
jgi:hypothetical protein